MSDGQCFERRGGETIHLFVAGRRLCLCGKEEKPGLLMQVESRRTQAGPETILGLPIESGPREPGDADRG